MKFDSTQRVTRQMFEEDWGRYVVKMATGSGKTKVMSLFVAWSYFHKLYEEQSRMSRNFLVIAPNIIVLERLRMDFGGLKVFYEDPVIPSDGWNDNNWKSDFNLTVHIQDNVQQVSKVGNLFLTNIHRVYESKDTVFSWIKTKG